MPTPKTTQAGERTQHTPGPWHVERPYGEPGLYISSDSTALIAKVYEQSTFGGIAPEYLKQQQEEEQANARLIAAAPETKAQRDELLEACKKAATIIENENTCFKESIRAAAIEVLAEINAAIAKTEGRAL